MTTLPQIFPSIQKSQYELQIRTFKTKIEAVNSFEMLVMRHHIPDERALR